MANLVFNELTIFGSDWRDNELAQQIIHDLYNHGMAWFMPMPKYLLNKPYGQEDPTYPGWLTWAYTNWGTKWDMYDEGREIDCNYTLKFTTANGSIEPFAQWLQDEFPHLSVYLYFKEELNEPEEFRPIKKDII